LVSSPTCFDPRAVPADTGKGNAEESAAGEIRLEKFDLTPRKLEIVSAVVAGYSNKEIAEYFKISEDSVNSISATSLTS
jgi:DNA-binding NarL/FixJ family response regulator